MIGYVPTDLNREIVQVHNRKFQNHYELATDELLVKDTTAAVAYYIFGAVFILIGLFFYAVEGFTEVKVPLIGLAIATIFFTYGYTIPKKETILDRHNSTIFYSDWFFFGSHTVPFDELEVFWTSTGGASGALGQRLITRPPRPSWPRAISLNTHTGPFDKSWSLIVWYMDRNRPLPPGDAFDEYRERDFARRRAEGFPPPLYPSRFPTPEATPAQNAERRRHWRDEDHYGTSETAWY